MHKPYLFFILFLSLLVPSTYGQLLSEEEIQNYKSFFPKFEDGFVTKLVDNPKTVWYNEKVMPRIFLQLSADTPYGELTPFWINNNISGDAREQSKGDGFGGSVATDKPYRVLGGTDNSKVFNIRAMILPEDENGKLKPIAYYDEIYYRYYWLGNNQHLPLKGLAWIYPTGTVFMEAIAIDGPKGRYICEIRCRIKMKDYWEVAIYRPFKNLQELEAKVKELRPDSNYDLTPRLKYEKFADNDHPTNHAIDLEGYVLTLPNFDEELVHDLLTKTEFKNCTNESFYDEDGKVVFAPTSNSEFNIVPKNYQATFLGTDAQSCKNCHEHSGSSATLWDFSRDWYGNLQLGDNIFSMHIFDKSGISTNGAPGRNILNKTFVNMGILERYNNTKHATEDYNIVEDYHKLLEEIARGNTSNRNKQGRTMR
jgi:hypothetical protein